MPGRTWVIAPDAESLQRRWQRLLAAPKEQKDALFHPHLRGGVPGDKHAYRVVPKGLPGYEPRPLPVADERGPAVPPVRYGFRSFDRQWIIPDNRLINQPNPFLWAIASPRQVYLTALTRTAPSSGPALTFTGLIPDLDHYKGSFGGRAFPLWRDRAGREPNLAPGLPAHLSAHYGRPVGAEDLFAYIAGVAAHPAFTARFQADLVQPGLRIPLTADGARFDEAAELGRMVIWLHSFGERFADPGAGRPAAPPRMPPGQGPTIPLEGAIGAAGDMPDRIDYDAAARRLLVGDGSIDNVAPAVWDYEVSGKQVLRQWFSYRRANRERPIIGDRRPPSPLGDIQPPNWPAEYTSELLNVLHVLGRLVALEPAQADLLARICAGPTLSVGDLRAAGVLAAPAGGASATAEEAGQLRLLEE